jgi:cytochrome c oxidase subunit 2
MKRLGVVLAVVGAGLALLSALPRPAVAGDGREAVSYGRALFQAKGCTACHLHREVNPGAGVAVGPDLTEVVLDPAYLRAWLLNPASIRPGTRMPNLGLSESEIEALIAFINYAAE